jgi:Na+-driven multidrug efflux pump
MESSKQLWQEEQGQDINLSDILNNKVLSSAPSPADVLAKLRRNLRISFIWAILITLIYAVVIVYFGETVIRLLFLLLVGFNSWVIYTNYRLLGRLSAPPDAGLSLKQVLVSHLDSFAEWWKVQSRVALLVYPVSASAGFVAGGVLGSGKPIETFMSKPFVWWILAASIAVLTPLCWLLERAMYRIAYGAHLRKISSLVEELERD